MMAGLPVVLQQHAEQAALMWRLRAHGTQRPNFSLLYLDRFDRRLAAYLDGLAVSAADGWPYCDALLENPSPGALFVVAHRAIDDRDDPRVERLVAIAEAVPVLWGGLTSAFGWHEPERLQGIVARMLTSSSVWARATGIAACALHRVHAGQQLLDGMLDPEPLLRSRSIKAAGELGLIDSLEQISLSLVDGSECGVWAAWSSVLLGERGVPLDRLVQFGDSDFPGHRAVGLALQAAPVARGRALIQAWRQSGGTRMAIRSAGIVGDPALVPDLLGDMHADAVARSAGESFTLITGVDLAAFELERKPPDNFETGPSDDPDDDNVDMDPDEGLPWPDAARIEQWWAANSSRFSKGTRYFMGQPVSRDHCIHVLKTGYQPQRILAARYLCLLNPGTPLFNTSAPAWRQQRLLAAM